MSVYSEREKIHTLEGSLRFRMRYPRSGNHRRKERSTHIWRPSKNFRTRGRHGYKNTSRGISRSRRFDSGRHNRFGGRKRREMERRYDDRKRKFENQSDGRNSSRDVSTIRVDENEFKTTGSRSVEVTRHSDHYQRSSFTDDSEDENSFRDTRSRSVERLQISDTSSYRYNSSPESRSPERFQRLNRNQFEYSPEQRNSYNEIMDVQVPDELFSGRQIEDTVSHYDVSINSQDGRISNIYLDNSCQGKYEPNMNRYHNHFENESDTYRNHGSASKFDPHPNESMPIEDKAAYMMKMLMSNGGEMIAAQFKREMMAVFPTERLLIEFLDKFKSLFHIKSISGLDEEEGEISETSKALVMVRTDLNLCMEYSSSSQNCPSSCGGLHICKFFILSQCPSTNCKFRHLLTTPHNADVLRRHFLHTLTKHELADLMKMHPNRRGVTIPLICKFYNYNSSKCRKESCPFLHICKNLDTCRLPSCKLEHSLNGSQPSMILSKYGLHPGQIEGGDDDIFALLRANADSAEQQCGISSCVEMKSFAKHRKEPSLSIKIFENNEEDKFHWSLETEEGSKIKLYDAESSDLEEKYVKYLEAKRVWIRATGRNVAVDLSRLEGIIEIGQEDKIVKMIRDKTQEDK